MTSETHEGGCLCGAVRYRVRGPLNPVAACHCRQCQRTSGNYVAATSARREAVGIEGEPRWFRSSKTARRGFCAACGSNLFWDGGGDRLSIHAGTLDAPARVALTRHIFCADKGDWYRIADGLPQFLGPDL
ncbi:GFA family protein [Jannaschia sp. W003]|uniref:GFA family protein n=1 Tax=Jannaschia sp. W003 TaxID=2867012 RepID=UPI0021A7B200|nr:GFA family protein [Jannaschia sp. W003]UWQ20879.1 GFA family protein [Jannaschia sp. W003]